MPLPLQTRSTNSPPAVLGRVDPRIVTPPVRDDLWTNEDASWGYDFADFCALIGWPLREWQRRLGIRLGELLADGSPRFRKAIILIARQNGKTLFARLLILYWMFTERVPEILATSTDRAGAKRSWRKVVEMAEAAPLLAEALPARHTALQIGEEDFWNDHGSHYRFAAPTRRAGRGDTLHRALLDELREHRNRDVWDAVVPAMNAVGEALLVAISNEGDAESIVLHEEYDAALGHIETGEGDARTFLAAWSCPAGSDPTDLDVLAYANPSLGDGLYADALLGQALAAVRAGGETLQRFRIEMMCERVDLLDSAIDLDDWRACGVRPDQAVDLAEHARGVVLALDIAHENADHATLAAGVTLDGVTHVEIVEQWEGHDARARLRRDLPALVARIKPRKVLLQESGPAAAVVADLGHRAGWPSRVRLEALTAADVVRACMGLEEQAAAGQVRHAFDPLLDQHVRQSQRLPQGDGWRFSRRGREPIDAAYAAAFAVHGARALPRLAPYRSAYGGD